MHDDPYRWRRWLAMALAGAVVGTAAAVLVRRALSSVEGQDAPDALPPEDVMAVVDRPAG